MQQWVRKWGVAALLLLAGAVLRVLFVRHHPFFAGDSMTYGDLASNILRHDVYGFTEAKRIRPTLIRLPGYPLFLAGCFAVFGVWNFVAVIWVQFAVSMAECCLLGVLGARLGGRRVGLAVLGLAALCPFTANYCAVPLTETWTMFCVTLALFSIERWAFHLHRDRPGNAWLLPLGFALAFGVLLRPDQALLPAAIFPAMIWIGVREGQGKRRRRVWPVVGLAAAITVPFLIWGARNWHVFHVVQLLAPRYANDPGEFNSYGFQRWYRTWAIDYKATVDVYWNYDGSPLQMVDLPPRAFDSPAQQAETADLYARYNQADAASRAFDAAFAKIAADRVRAHPLRYYTVLPVLKVADMWLRPRTEFMRLPVDWWRFRAHPWQSVECVGYALLDAAYLALAAVGLWRWKQRRWTGHAALAGAMIAFMVLRTALLLTIDNSEPRYTLECFPMVILVAGFALMGRETLLPDTRQWA